jgi:SAM-dependent methyltransferase
MTTTAESTAAALMQDSKTPVLAALLAARFARPINRLLVVGCGSGIEAAVLGRELRCSVVGIDPAGGFDATAASLVSLEIGDATALRFADGTFDFVYSYHALEHIPDFRTALSEMSRVLADHGGFCIGTPNRARLVGYLGSTEASWREKIAWNISDWRAMLRGRFHNESGAHAGFTSQELGAALRDAFGTAIDISLDYYRAVYARGQFLVRAIDASGLGPLLLPSVYFIGHKTNARPR